jgi:hypothetical protein
MQCIGLNRNTIDKYYTKQSIVIQCIDIIKNNINISKNDIIIEPSAGNGAFYKIKELSDNCYFYDIEPDHKDIIKQDFLTLEISKENKKIHIIGNPPFGRQSSLAIKFIKKCCLFASSISFILPKSFKKDSMKKYFLKNYHLITEIDISDISDKSNNAFLVNNIEYNVPCIFQIWEYRDEERIDPIKLEPINFKFVEKNDSPSISFRRVGVNAGTISKEIENKSHQSHYFIKFTNTDIDKIIDKLKDIKFNNNNTVGPKSISKQELIKEFNKFI